MLTLGSSSAFAESLVVPFELNVAGDDESESRYFDTTFPSDGPTLLTLDGFAENLETGETSNGAGVSLLWYATDGSQQRVEIRFDTPEADPVGGLVQVPYHLEQPLDFTPPRVGFRVEGFGPGDDLDFTGTFTYTQIPEPAGAALAAIGFFMIAGGRWRKRSKVKSGKRFKR
jgi:hypothetical protein